MLVYYNRTNFSDSILIINLVKKVVNSAYKRLLKCIVQVNINYLAVSRKIYWLKEEFIK